MGPVRQIAGRVVMMTQRNADPSASARYETADTIAGFALSPLSRWRSPRPWVPRPTDPSRERVKR